MLKNKSTKNKTSKESLKKPEVFIMTQSNTEELKNARSATTGEKFDTLDERIDCEVDRLNKKIDVSMLQQEDKESHAIENSIEGMTTDMVIKGRTLINMVKLGSVSNVIGIVYDTLAIYSYMYNLKNDTDYTIIFEIENKTDNNQVRISLNNGNKGQGFDVKNGINIIKIRSNAEKNNKLMFYYGSEYSGNGTVKNVILLEGDWTNKPIPQYFEGIKSFGQQEDKISILSHGKNFFNINEFSEKINEKGELEFKADGNSRVANYMQIYTERNLNSKIIFNGYDSVGREFTTVNQEKYYIWVGLHGDKKDNKVWGEIILPKNTTCYYSAINEKGDNFVKFKDIQIEIGTSKTHYEHYKEDKKDILLQDLGFDEGLRGLNDIVYDELNSIKNVVIKRVDKYIVTGNENFITDIRGDYMYCYFILEGSKPSSGLEAICNQFKYIDGLWNKDNPSVQGQEGFDLSGSNSLSFQLSINKLETHNTEGVKKYFKSLYDGGNPVEVYYWLAEPIEIPLDENINPKTFNEKTYVSFENAISGASSFKAPVNAAATISRLNRENRALEEENKNLRQDFESTTLTLTDSDLELVKQNVDMDFRLMEVEFALDIPQAILSSNIKFKNKKGEVKSMARTPYEMMKIVILSGDYDREDYIHKVGKYYERGRMTKEEHDELMSLMTADEVISK